MNYLRKRVKKLEAFIKEDAEEIRSNKPYRLSDLTSEELHQACACSRRNEPFPPDLAEKLRLTDITGSSRTAGMTREEKIKLLREFREKEVPDADLAFERFLEEPT